MRDREYFLNLLTHSYAQTRTQDRSIVGRLNYLGDYVFNITTYDSSVSEFFAAIALQVAAAITDSVTCEYIEQSAAHYRWYLAMVNLPFFKCRIEWGGSIRGAWWEHLPQPNPLSFVLTESELLGLYEGIEQLDKLELTRGEWLEFIYGMLLFAEDELASFDLSK
jgi:hypothetical protein